MIRIIVEAIGFIALGIGLAVLLLVFLAISLSILSGILMYVV